MQGFRCFQITQVGDGRCMRRGYFDIPGVLPPLARRDSAASIGKFRPKRVRLVRGEQFEDSVIRQSLERLYYRVHKLSILDLHEAGIKKYERFC